MKHGIRFIAAVFMTLVFGLFQSGGAAMAIEKPDYTVEREDGKIEIRSYPPMLLAEVQVEGDRDTSANRGFRKLANFIFGDNVSATNDSSKISMTAPVMQSPQNAQSEKIAMTSPVVQTPETDVGVWTVNFMMPSKYSLETLPKPTDNDIRIYMSEPYRSVSLRFSGRSTVKNITKHEKKLLAWVEKEGLSIAGEPEYAFYDAPFIPPMFRRNEVHFRLQN